MEIVVYGMGKTAVHVLKILSHCYDWIRIKGFTDSTSITGKLFHNYAVFNIEDIPISDYIIVAVADSNISEQIFAKLETEVCGTKAVKYMEFLNDLRKAAILEKYKDETNTEILGILNWLKNNQLTVRNKYDNTEVTGYRIEYGENGYPYLWYLGKKMYLPKDYPFNYTEDGEPYVENIVECDQYEGSPHLYIKSGHEIKDGDVIVDAGVAEGNFTLRYIDKVSKAYLIEPDERWLEVLKLTFEPYKEKVVFVPKMLGDCDSYEMVTLDGLLENETCDFIKMDIEGAESSALLGGMNILKNSKVKLSICTYHKKRDYQNISFILNSLGFKTSHSDGYMCFLYDEAFDLSLDFRRGMIYGNKLMESQ